MTATRGGTAAVSIVHLIPHDGIGGVEVAARSVPPEPMPNVSFRLMPIAGGSFEPPPAMIVSRWKNALNPVAQVAAALKLARLAPDILVCSLWKSIPAALLTKLLRPRVAMVMFLHLDRPIHWVDAMLHWLGMKVADEVWADSAQTLAARQPPAATPQRIVSFVIDRLEARPSRGLPQLRFVAWSRLTYQKGIDRALDLLALLRDRDVPFRFDIWGPDGGEEASLKRQATALGLDRSVRFRGIATREALPNIAAENSMFLQLSRFEGMAMGVVEAMQMGLVPVTTAAGEIRRYVVDWENGIIVDPQNLSAAADRVIALSLDQARLRRMSSEAIARWRNAPLYADDLARFSVALAANRRALAPPRPPA